MYREFSMFKSYLGKVEDVILTFFRFSAWFWALSESYCYRFGGGFLNPQDDVHKALVFSGVSMVIEIFRGTPWSIYETFVVEERHGFNK